MDYMPSSVTVSSVSLVLRHGRVSQADPSHYCNPGGRHWQLSVAASLRVITGNFKMIQSVAKDVRAGNTANLNELEDISLKSRCRGARQRPAGRHPKRHRAWMAPKFTDKFAHTRVCTRRTVRARPGGDSEARLPGLRHPSHDSDDEGRAGARLGLSEWARCPLRSLSRPFRLLEADVEGPWISEPGPGPSWPGPGPAGLGDSDGREGDGVMTRTRIQGPRGLPAP
jgi:hypothetical protein